MSRQAMNKKVTTTIDHRGVATVTLNRPHKHNAFDADMIAELTAALQQIGSTANVRVMILTAAGKTFSAGADLQWMRRMGDYSYEENLKDAETLAQLLKTLDEMPTPTIARINGAAFGGALGLISCCDIAIATEHSAFCFSEVKIGLIPATISPYIIRAMGTRNTRRYFMTGESFTAQSAVTLGLIHEAVESVKLDIRIEAMVNALLKNSPAAITAVKKLLENIDNQAISETTQRETSQRLAEIRMSDEGQEGLSAFLEKRQPSWQDKN